MCGFSHLRSLDDKDFGMYSCHAKNDLGTASTQIELFRAEVEPQPPLDPDPDPDYDPAGRTTSKGISVHWRGEYFSSAIALTLSFVVFLFAHITPNAQSTLRLAEFW